MMEKVQEVLYETRHHVSRPFCSNYPPQQANSDSGRSFLSVIPGLSQFKQRWNEPKKPRKLKKLISLIVSLSGEYVAVAAGNQITILKKSDDYREPCGIFTNRTSSLFTTGAWSEYHDVLGVIDDSDMLFFIKANGDEITRIKLNDLRVSQPIVALIEPDEYDRQRSCLFGFTIVTSGGFLQHIEICQDSSASISSSCSSNSDSPLRKQLQNDIYCLDYHPQISLLAVASSTGRSSGSCSISVWRRNSISDLEHLVSSQFEGFFIKPESYQGLLSYPKVTISPQGTFVATLDVTGSLHVFRFDQEGFLLLSVSSGQRYESVDILKDVLDFAWWSDKVIALAKRKGVIIMVDVSTGLKLKNNALGYNCPVLERPRVPESRLFLVETRSVDYRQGSSTYTRKTDAFAIEEIAGYSFNHLDTSQFHWSLTSFSEKSIHDMYDLLICDGKYEAALEFADSHGLDRDEVMKSQWLHSDHGVKEIDKFLTVIKDRDFILSECMKKVGPSEDAVKALLEFGLLLTNPSTFGDSEDSVDQSNMIWDLRLARLKLLQCKDRLETYMGVSMGRFSVQEYTKFRDMPINGAAVHLAESGKIGALNLIFKRHPYSLAPFMLEVLSAIPETVPVQSYRQLLPGESPPASIAVREEDWVECERMVEFINRLPRDNKFDMKVRTELIIKQSDGLLWPSADELSRWYKKRAIDIDSYSGQLDNCLTLIDVGQQRGISGLQQFYEDVSFFNQLIYTVDTDSNSNNSLSLVAWEQLSEYEKFKLMVKGVEEEFILERLHDKTIPFMQKSMTGDHVSHPKTDSFLVRWLKEIASENNLDMLLVVIDEGCKDLETKGFFKDEVEAVECILQCLYLCTATDRWGTMSTILLKLPQLQDMPILEGKLKLAEGHIEAGRILAFYQVPKPLNFFPEAHSDEKGVKQIFRLILSKFGRRQPAQSDNDWASMWRDMQTLREKAFNFLDPEFMLMEFCRGLLKAGKFSLARNYLRGTSSVSLASEKAENLVIQAAREYFFSASSLTSAEIWKAKECLNLFPASSNVKAEIGIIEAVTVKLPELGVTLLPMQFRQIKDPMEIIKMAITSQPGAYLHVDELIEVAKLLGLSSVDDISAVEEAIAREAAVAGDLQLAFDLALLLVKKGHGPIWDLSAAIARGPALENMDTSSRKILLGFALSHCDEESISELLHAWKDLDMQSQCETLMTLTGTSCPNISFQSATVISYSFHNKKDEFPIQSSDIIVVNDQKIHLNAIKDIISAVAKNVPFENLGVWGSHLSENEKVLSFAALQLPWLLEISRSPEYGKISNYGFMAGKHVSIKTHALVTILSWLIRSDFAPRDDLIVSLAKSVFELPVTEEEDIIGCSFLLNLVDAVNGVEAIEEQLRTRQTYTEISSIMNMGMKYGLLHNSQVESEGSASRRGLLMKFFREKRMPLTSDELNKFGKVQSTFWRQWKSKLEEQKRVTDQSRVLEQLMPGVQAARFLSGDKDYIENAVFSLIDSLKMEKKHILNDILKLVDIYSLNRSQVLLRFMISVLVSGIWPNDDITVEIAEVKGEVIGYGWETIRVISSMVYPVIDGKNKQRLAYIYGLLADCYLQCVENKVALQVIRPDLTLHFSVGLAEFYKIIEQECQSVAFVENLNFKNIAALDGLNLQYFSREVYQNVNEHSLEALARMVKTLTSVYSSPLPEGLISWRNVYKHYILIQVASLESLAKTEFNVKKPESFQGLIAQLERSYDICRRYIKFLTDSDISDVIKRFFYVSVLNYGSDGNLPDNSAWQECLILLLNFFIRVTEEIHEISQEDLQMITFKSDCLMNCLKSFIKLVIEDSVSPSQGWATLISYITHGFTGDFIAEVLAFCRAMIFSGCGFIVIAEVFSEAVSQSLSSLTAEQKTWDLPLLYLDILDHILQDLGTEVHSHQLLCLLLSSLSKLDGDMEELRRVRRVVWERMDSFSNDLQVPGQVRVYALELMQVLTGRHIKVSSVEPSSNLLPWEGWDELSSAGEKGMNNEHQSSSDFSDASNRFTSHLVVLRSSNIVATISPSLEITADDVSDPDSALSCFVKLCAAANTDSHVSALLAVLREWEGLFVAHRKDEEVVAEATDAGNDWADDGWDEGWESFQEVEPLEKGKKGSSHPIHPLHACWTLLLEKYISHSRFEDVLRILDESLSNDSGPLLDEVSARSLGQAISVTSCCFALKMALLLPYVELQSFYLDSMEDKLIREGITDSSGRDIEVLILVLSSGIISSVISKATYGNIFSYICYLVGHFSRQCQEAQLQGNIPNGEGEARRLFIYLFGRIVLPCFICYLVKVDQQILAGFILSKFMHTNAALGYINVADASLRRYMEGQLHIIQHDDFDFDKLSSSFVLKHTMLGLRSKLADLIPSALSLLPIAAR